MKPSLALGLSLILASALVLGADAQDVAPVVTAPAMLSAAQILEKSRQTYAAFSVYKGSCSVVSDTVIAVGDGEPMQSVSSASATIGFERGQRLSVEGVDMGGSPFKAQWTPSEAWLEAVVGRGMDNDKGKTEREIIKGDAVLSAKDALVAGLTGLTSGTGSLLPSALQNDFWSNPFPTPKSQLELLASRNLGATPCYVIVATNPELNSIHTYWIEQKTFLLRRLTQEIGEQRYDDMPAIDGKPLPIYRIAYSLNQYVFATTEAK